MDGSSKSESWGAGAGLNFEGDSPPTIRDSSSHDDHLGQFYTSDKAFNPAAVYAVTGEQLLQVLKTAISVGRSQHTFKKCEERSVRLPNVPMPIFNGNNDEKGCIANNFLRKLECYVASQRYTYSEALEMVLPCALDGSAGLWWEAEGEKFKNWYDFLRSFKKEFGVIATTNNHSTSNEISALQITQNATKSTSGKPSSRKAQKKRMQE